MKKGEMKKVKKHRWSKNDTELTVLAIPTAIWYVLFCFIPMFGLVIAFKNYKWYPDRILFRTCLQVTGMDLKTLIS